MIFRRTVSTGFIEPKKCPRGFLGEGRTRSYGQDVATLPETLIRKQETFTSIPEDQAVEESGTGSLCRKLELLPGLGIALNILTVIINQVFVI